MAGGHRTMVLWIRPSLPPRALGCKSSNHHSGFWMCCRLWHTRRSEVVPANRFPRCVRHFWPTYPANPVPTRRSGGVHPPIVSVSRLHCSARLLLEQSAVIRCHGLSFFGGLPQTQQSRWTPRAILFRPDVCATNRGTDWVLLRAPGRNSPP